MKRFQVVLFLMMFIVGVPFVDAEELDVKLASARQVLNIPDLKPSERAVVEKYITLLEKRQAGTDTAIVQAYSELYELCHYEYMHTRRSTLFREFQFDYAGIPLLISQICRNSEEISAGNKTHIIQAQRSRSSDPRITSAFLKCLEDSKGLTNVIGYCVREISKGDKSLQIPVAKYRVKYQQQIINDSLRERHAESWSPNVIEHSQLKTALTEAKRAISESPGMLAEYEKLFYGAFELFEAKEDAAGFYEFAVFQGEKLREADPALVMRLKQHAARFKAPKERGVRGTE